MDKDLTVLLITKDRERFLYRWMAYAQYIKFPFKVFIADGGKDNSTARHFSNTNKYNGLDYMYKKYPYDKSYTELYSKVVDALTNIETPYTVWADDDDFYFPKGLRKSMDFLANNPSYSSCRGVLGSFSVNLNNRDNISDCYGKNINYTFHAKPFRENDVSIKNESPQNRLKYYLSQRSPTWYDMHRTEHALNVWRTIRDSNFENILLAECLLDILNVISGKVHRFTDYLSDLYLMRQNPPPESVARTFREKFGDSFGQMLAPSWSNDFSRFVNSVSRSLENLDSLNSNEAKRIAIDVYRKYIGKKIIKDLEDGNVEELSYKKKIDQSIFTIWNIRKTNNHYLSFSRIIDKVFKLDSEKNLANEIDVMISFLGNPK